MPTHKNALFSVFFFVLVRVTRLIENRGKSGIFLRFGIYIGTESSAKKKEEYGAYKEIKGVGVENLNGIWYNLRNRTSAGFVAVE